MYVVFNQVLSVIGILMAFDLMDQCGLLTWKSVEAMISFRKYGKTNDQIWKLLWMQSKKMIVKQLYEKHLKLLEEYWDHQKSQHRTIILWIHDLYYLKVLKNIKYKLFKHQNPIKSKK